MAGLLSLASAIVGRGSFLSHGAEHVYIIPAKAADATPDFALGRALQYWPAELADNFSPTYSNKGIPGGNRPLYQWSAGGERQFSFTAVFSTDTAEVVSAANENKHNVNVTGAIKWLRSLCEPSYTQGVPFANPPPLLYLVFPFNELGKGRNDYVLTFMSQCDVTRKKWFPNGRLRLAEVNLGFTEVVQDPVQTTFYGADDYAGSSMDDYRYKLGSKPSMWSFSESSDSGYSPNAGTKI